MQNENKHAGCYHYSKAKLLNISHIKTVIKISIDAYVF